MNYLQAGAHWHTDQKAQTHTHAHTKAHRIPENHGPPGVVCFISPQAQHTITQSTRLLPAAPPGRITTVINTTKEHLTPLHHVVSHFTDKRDRWV